MSNPFADLHPIVDRHAGMTFDQWKKEGYSVMRGEKATGRNGDGIPTFTQDQVTYIGDDTEEEDRFGMYDEGPVNRF